MSQIELYAFLSGCLLATFLTSSLFFWRFWNKTQDRFFAIFSFAFFLLGLERLPLTFNPLQETKGYVYLIRLLAYILILVAIADKNRSLKRK